MSKLVWKSFSWETILSLLSSQAVKTKSCMIVTTIGSKSGGSLSLANVLVKYLLNKGKQGWLQRDTPGEFIKTENVIDSTRICSVPFFVRSTTEKVAVILIDVESHESSLLKLIGDISSLVVVSKDTKDLPSEDFENELNRLIKKGTKCITVNRTDNIGPSTATKNFMSLYYGKDDDAEAISLPNSFQNPGSNLFNIGNTFNALDEYILFELEFLLERIFDPSNIVVKMENGFSKLTGETLCIAVQGKQNAGNVKTPKDFKWLWNILLPYIIVFDLCLALFLPFAETTVALLLFGVFGFTNCILAELGQTIILLFVSLRQSWHQFFKRMYDIMNFFRWLIVVIVTLLYGPCKRFCGWCKAARNSKDHYRLPTNINDPQPSTSGQ